MYNKSILLLVAAAFCVTFASAQTKSPWEVFRSAKGKFSVSMPCKPEIESQPKDAEGPELTFHSCNNTSGSFVVTYADFDVVLGKKAMLDAYVDGTVAGATLVSQKSIWLGRIPGRELVLSSTKDDVTTISKWRIYLSGKRIYSVTVATDAPVPAEADISKFMSSFAIRK